MPLFDIKIEILKNSVTLTYDLDPKNFHQFWFRGSSGIYLVNFKVISEELTKIEILLKIGKISELLVKRTFDPRYPKGERLERTHLAMCPEKMKTICWVFFQFCWTNDVFKHSTYLTLVTLTFEKGQNK